MTITRLPNETDAAYIARLTAALQAAPAPGKLTLKVSEKGAVSVYGNGRWPTTFYKEQWLRLLDFGDTIRQFIKDNDSRLSVKGEDRPAATQPAA